MTAVEYVNDEGSVALAELLDRHDLVSVEPREGYIVMSRRDVAVQLAKPASIDTGLGLQELGYTSMSPWTAWTRDERMPELRDKRGIRTYYDLKRSDGDIRGSLRLVKTPIQAAHWYLEPASDSAEDKNIAKFVQKALFDGLNVDWSQVLDDVLLMFDYGYMVFEKVYKFDKDGKVVLQKLAPRHPLDIMEWVFDDRGGPNGIIMEPFVPFGNLGISGPSDQLPFPNMGQFIPIRKLVIFSLEAEAGDLRGISVLRSAYKHWYYKDTLYKIDAIQKERHGIGVPVILLPPGFSKEDKILADEIGRNLRTNERAHIVIPANWVITFAKLEGQPVSAIESINHHSSMIRVNVLAPFMGEARPDQESTDMFFKSTRYLAASISNIFNRFVIRQLVDMNFRRTEYPKLRARRIGEWNDLRTLSFAVRNFVGAGMITPDDVLEAQIRDETDLPPMDKATARPIIQGGFNNAQPPHEGGGDPNQPHPPGPSPAQLPRQTSRPFVGPPKNNSGRDVSGGSST